MKLITQVQNRSIVLILHTSSTYVDLQFLNVFFRDYNTTFIYTHYFLKVDSLAVRGITIVLNVPLEQHCHF